MVNKQTKSKQKAEPELSTTNFLVTIPSAKQQ